jgi:type II secretory pathway predicted ATPase ExeA
VVGTGKTQLLWRLQGALKSEGKIQAIQSLAVDKHRVTLDTLKLAIYYGLATEKDPNDLPTKPEKSEFILMRVIHRCAKPIALFVDDAHDLHSQTLLAVKRFGELMRQRGVHLAVVLAGHPKLKNDLRRPVIEEIGSRSTVLELEGIKGQQQRYITWLLGQCTKPKVKLTDILTEQALTLLAERLATPLQIEHYLTLAMEQAYRFGEKLVTPEIIETVMASDLNALIPTLTRHGYNVKALSELLNLRQAEVKAFLHGQLPPGRTEELKQQVLKEGIPL